MHASVISLILEQNVKKIMIQTDFKLFKRQSHKFSLKKLKIIVSALNNFFSICTKVFNILIILDTNLFIRLRKVDEHKKQVTQASNDIMEMGDKNKKSNTTTSATKTPPHTSKSNEVNNTKSSLKKN